jgi:23S rRNA pseudouridine1911/1915/1917 synthase
LTLTSRQPILGAMEQPDIPIIYQDHHLLIVNKPANLVIHPTYKHANDTMWDALLAYLALHGPEDWQPADMPDEVGWEHAPESVRQMLRAKRLAKLYKEEGLMPRPALLHRLDRDTSGVVALARTERACRHVAHQFSTHTTVKTYLAVARRGSPDWTRPQAEFTVSEKRAGLLSWPLDLSQHQGETLLLDGPLRRDPDDRRRCIVGEDGQLARTQVKILSNCDDYFFLEVHPITGRTHQIRTHLAAAGYALVGDTTYASIAEPATPASQLARQFLHAYSLTLREYPTNCQRTFVAPLPVDLTSWLTTYFPAWSHLPSSDPLHE